MSCEHIKFADGSAAIVCGVRRGKKIFCSCGRSADFLCDWKVPEHNSETCDRGVCKTHAQQVAPEKHLCQEHQKSYAAWQSRHPMAAQPQQGSLFAVNQDGAA